MTCALSLIAPARASLPPTVPAPSRHFETDRTFEHPLFETEAQCERARLQAPAANCAQWIAFTADGRATVVLAERLERASYEIRGERVVLTLRDPAPGVPARIELRLADNRRHLVHEGTGSVWEARKDRAATDSAVPPATPTVESPAGFEDAPTPTRRPPLPAGGITT